MTGRPWQEATPRVVEPVRLVSRGHRAVWAAATLIWVAWAAVRLGWPWARDEGIFAWLGHVVAGGGIPYRDAWDTKGPAVFWVAALADRVAGGDLRGLRILDLAIALLAAAGLAALARTIGSPRSAGYAALLYLLWLAGLTSWPTPQPDAWVAAALILGFLPLVSDRPPTAMGWAASGLAVGFATLVKPLYVLYALVPIARPLAGPRGERGGRGVAIAAGAAAAVGAGALGWFAAHGAVRELWDAQVTFNLGTYAGGSGRNLLGRIDATIAFFLRPAVAVLLPAAALGVWGLRGLRQQAAVIGSWAAVALLCVPIQGWFFGYHWIPLYPVLALLGARGIDQLCERRHAPDRILAVVMLALIVGIPARAALDHVLLWRRAAAGRVAPESYAAQFRQYGDSTFAEATTQAAAYVRTRTEPDDRILVWGTQPLVYRLSDRAAASRFGFNLPLVAGRASPLRQRYRALFIDDLRRARPAYLLVVEDDFTDLVPRSSDAYVAEFPALADLLATRYRADTTIGRYRIYRRR